MSKTFKAMRERLLDGADLLIDFATLGEYGVVPADADCRQQGRSCHGPGPARHGKRVEAQRRVAA